MALYVEDIVTCHMGLLRAVLDGLSVPEEAQGCQTMRAASLAVALLQFGDMIRSAPFPSRKHTVCVDREIFHFS